MEERLYRLNTTYAILDTIVCLAAIACFGLAAFHFGRWWISLFNLVPLMLYSQRGALIELKAPEEDIECMKEKEGDHGYDRP